MQFLLFLFAIVFGLGSLIWAGHVFAIFAPNVTERFGFGIDTSAPRIAALIFTLNSGAFLIAAAVCASGAVSI